MATTDIGRGNIKDAHAHAVEVPPDFDFAATVWSSGWSALAPNRADRRAGTLERTWRVAGGTTVVRLDQPDGRGARVRLAVVAGRGSRGGLPSGAWTVVAREARHMLRLDEDLAAFHHACREAGGAFTRAADLGFGRLLRSPTLFEDVVKVLATTNTTWSGTIAMVRNLVAAADDGGAFPTPARVAELGAKRIREEARWGYRAGSLARLAEDVASGALDLSLWEEWPGTTEELEREIRRVPGLGPYAAAQVLALVGRYDRIGVDTVFRAFVRKAHFPRARAPVPDRRLLDVYRRWGSWRMLAYWFELWVDHTESSAPAASESTTADSRSSRRSAKK